VSRKLQDSFGKRLLDKKTCYPGLLFKKNHVRSKCFEPDGDQKSANLGRETLNQLKAVTQLHGFCRMNSPALGLLLKAEIIF